jgi:hypothetical protein
MRHPTIITLGSILAVLILGGRVQACWQPDVPSVSLRSRRVAGKISLNGKPIAGSVVSLNKFLGPHAIEIGHADPHPLRKTIAGDDGRVDFGEVPIGKYVIFMASPSGELINVEVVRPRSDDNDTIDLSFFADFCQTASVLSASGERLKRSTPPIAGISGTSR